MMLILNEKMKKQRNIYLLWNLNLKRKNYEVNKYKLIYINYMMI